MNRILGFLSPSLAVAVVMLGFIAGCHSSASADRSKRLSRRLRVRVTAARPCGSCSAWSACNRVRSRLSKDAVFVKLPAYVEKL